MDSSTLGWTPIPGDNPAGSEAKYEPEYEAVLAEIDKLGSASQGGVISWPVVAEKAEALLANKSKDLLIAAYLGVAWQEIRGAEGLRDALTLFSGLFANFWESAFPPLARLRRRTNAFDWWHERALALLQNPDKNTQPLPAAFLNELEEQLNELDRLSGDLMPDALPLRDMYEHLRRLPVLPEEKPPDPAPTPPAAEVEAQEAPQTPPPEPAAPAPIPEAVPQSAPPSPPQATPSPAPAPVSPDEEFAASRKDFIEAARRYALLAHRVDACDPEPWQLVRMALWAKIQALPPADKGQTMLPPPDAMRLSALHSLLDAGKPLEAALEGEDFFPAALFCLDLQHLIDRALDALGPEYAEARNRVRGECGRFLRRLSGVETLTFSDGTPFAGPETQTWLQTLAEPAFAPPFPGQQAGAVSAPVSVGGSASNETDLLAQAEELFQKKQLDAALQLLENAQGRSPADNLILQVGELRLLCRAGEKTVAAALAQSLLETLDKRDLDNWNPSLAATVLLALRDAFALAQDQEAALAAQQRLARLRPSAALGWRHNNL